MCVVRVVYFDYITTATHFVLGGSRDVALLYSDAAAVAATADTTYYYYY